MRIKGSKLSEETRRKISLAKKGKPSGTKGMHWKLSEKTKRKMSLARRGEKNHAWRGEKVGYRALHHWVDKRLGQPLCCDKCGRTEEEKTKENEHQFHWANISREYKREITDWIRLCAKCHGEYDKGRKRKLSGKSLLF